jgi:ribosomal protein S18 acetylase RimI-like enzyme
VVVESEVLSQGADELFLSRGLQQVFAEDTMGCDPAAAERLEPNDGMELIEWEDVTAERFYAVYRAAFQDQPGFADESAGEWIEDYVGNPDFQPTWSLLLSLPGIGDAGFVTASAGWIGEVGVIPEARRRGIAGLLLREALARMAAAGTPHVALGVNVNNPGAAAVYRRIGFVGEGRRARYRLSGPGRP